MSSGAAMPAVTVVSADAGEGGGVRGTSPPASIAQRSQSLTFDFPVGGKRASPSFSTQPKLPERANSSEGALIAENVSLNEPQGQQKSQRLIPGPLDKKPAAKPTGSFRLLNDLKKTLSSNNLRNTANKDKTHATGGKSSTKTSGRSTPQTPEVRELFQSGKLCPDLDAVNRALDSLKAATSAVDDPLVSHLTQLAAQINTARVDGRKTLMTAMKERERGNPEICRALCLSIVQHEHSEVDTKVYAYNILSTQASPGQSLNYLAMAWNLVKQHEGKRSDCAKLLGVIAMLKDNILTNDQGNILSQQPNNGNSADRSISNRVVSVPREVCQPALVKDLIEAQASKLDPRNIGTGAITPRMEKILDWAEKDT